MKLNEIVVGNYYLAKVSERIVPVIVTRKSERTRNYYGWSGSSSQRQSYFSFRNLITGVEITGRASRFRQAITQEQAEEICFNYRTYPQPTRQMRITK